MTKAAANRDPSPYDGPIERIDGRRPYNRYLWPMPEDDWWAYDTFGHGVSSRFHLCVVALADGRWSTDGSVYGIERNRDCYGKSCVFDTREQAIRIAAARFIRMCRHARRWNGYDHLTDERCQQLINWALEIAKRPLPRQEPPRPSTGLPLFDHGASAC